MKCIARAQSLSDLSKVRQAVGTEFHKDTTRLLTENMDTPRCMKMTAGKGNREGFKGWHGSDNHQDSGLRILITKQPGFFRPGNK